MEDPIITKADDGKGQDLTPQKVVSDLKAIRESKGLTLKHVFERTRISVISLDAIEKEEFNLLPPPVFTKAFIKNYAKMLGCDSSEILARYEQYLETLKEPTQKEEVKEPSDKPQRQWRSKYFVRGLAIIAGVSIIVFFILSYKSPLDVPDSQIGEPAQQAEETKPPEAPPPEATGTTPEAAIKTTEEKDMQAQGTAQTAPLSQGAATGVNSQQVVASRETKQPAPAGTYPLTIVAKELTWVRVKAGEEPPQDVLLKPGEKIERTGMKFAIDLGNAGGVSIDFQGKSLGEVGKRGHVVHLKLPKLP
jgi:cytoskeleton protein RodZ